MRYGGTETVPVESLLSLLNSGWRRGLISEVDIRRYRMIESPRKFN